MSKQACKRLRRALRLDVSRNPLPSFTSLGCYPLFYLTKDGGVLCPDCVNKEIDLVAAAERDADPQWQVVAVDVHWEGEPMQCDHCHKQIEAAYAE